MNTTENTSMPEFVEFDESKDRLESAQQYRNDQSKGFFAKDAKAYINLRYLHKNRLLPQISSDSLGWAARVK